MALIQLFETFFLDFNYFFYSVVKLDLLAAKASYLLFLASSLALVATALYNLALGFNQSIAYLLTSGFFFYLSCNIASVLAGLTTD